MAFYWRVWATAMAVILAVLVIFPALAMFQFSRVHSDLVGERLVVLANRTAEPFEAAAGLGMPIADVRNATGLLERARQTDDQIGAIYVFGSDNDILHATVGARATGPAVAAKRAQAADGRDWHGTIDAGFIAGVNFTGLTGEPAGGVAVLYPRGGNVTRVWAMAAELSLAATGILCLSALLAGLLLRFGLRREISGFDHIDREISAFERDSWRGTAGTDSHTGLRAELDTAYRRYRDAVDKLGRAPSEGGR